MNTLSRPKLVIMMSIATLLCVAVLVYRSCGTYFAKIQKAEKLHALPVIAPSGVKEINLKKILPLDIIIPEGAGHIVESYKAKDSNRKVIIHMQDIHTNYEAQKNASRILESLIKSKGLKLIMVEGGWGDVGLSYLRSYSGKERRIEVAEEYLRAGKITGEEYLDIVSDYDLNLEGLEEEGLYKKNLDAFFEIERFRQKACAELISLKSSTEMLKEKIYPAQLQELERLKQDYEDEKISLAEYYKYITMLAKKVKQDISLFPIFSAFIKVTDSEGKISFQRVEKERGALIEKLSKILSKEKLTALVTKSLEFRLNKLTPAEYHSYLIEEAKRQGEYINDCPNLNRYVEYISSHEEIDTARLFDEADLLFSVIRTKLMTDQCQQRLNEISTAIRVLDNFLNLKLVPNDFKYYKEHKEDFITANWVGFLNNQLKRNKIKLAAVSPAVTVDKNIPALVGFYEIANERDDVFVRNAIRLMNEKNQDLAVLIAGGFHTPSLIEKLKECGISYIIVASHTTQQTDPEQYRHILKYKAGREE